MNDPMIITCLDLEGVLIPEIWIGLAEKTGIEELKLTTRDISDYDTLMKNRLRILDEHGLTLKDVREVTASMAPLKGALEFLNWLKEYSEVIILSDTFREFAKPLMTQLQNPTLFCHTLQINGLHQIQDYHLRQKDQKRKAVTALQSLNYRVIAIGDSYNDLSMMQEAHAGIFFRPAPKVILDYPDFPACDTYEDLKQQLSQNEGFIR